jgi:hypothetical protein
MIHRVVEDVLEGRVVLLLGFDHPRPEPLAEDVVLAPVALVERPCVLAVEVAHAIREVREGRLDDQVVVVGQQAAGVDVPSVAALDAVQDLHEDGAVAVVEEDRRLVVPFRADVVVRAGREVAVRSAHVGDRSRGERDKSAACVSRHTAVTDPSRARQRTRPREAWPTSERDVATSDALS